MTMCANGLFEKVAKELGVDEVPSNYADCSSLVQTEAEKESPDELYKKWQDYQESAEYIIECKHKPLDEDDYSQILWYGLAYDTDVVIISSHPVTNNQFTRDLNTLSVDVSIVSGIDIDTNFEKAQSKISDAVQ